MRKWIVRPLKDGICRAFEHKWGDITSSKQIKYLPREDIYKIQRSCSRCGTVRITEINPRTGQRQNTYMYPKGYLFIRKQEGEKLPTKAMQTLEVISTLRRKRR